MSYKLNVISDGDYYYIDRQGPLNEQTEELKLSTYWSAFTKMLDINPDIFANTLKLTPNIKILNIDKLDNFSENYIPLLPSITRLFKESYPKKLVEVAVHTPYVSWSNGITPEVDRIYLDLMYTLGHEQLQSVTIMDGTINQKTLNTEALTALFARSPHIKKIHFVLPQKLEESLRVPFELCQELEELHDNGLSDESIKGLKKCKKLHTWIINGTYRLNAQRELLMQPHGFDLRVLKFCDTPLISTNYELHKITKQLPNLITFEQKHFPTHSNKMTDEGLLLFAQNCKKLSDLSLAFEHITDKGFAEFVKYTPNLQKLSTFQCYNLGEEALIAIGKHCKRLKYLDLVHFKNVTKEGLIALAENCPQLELVRISHNSKVSLEGIEEFVKRAKRLKGITAYFNDYKDEDLAPIKAAYRHLNWSEQYREQDAIPLDPPLEIVQTGAAPNLSDEFLLEAARHGNLEDVDQLLKEGANPNGIGTVKGTLFHTGYTECPLGIAARLGHFDIVKRLVQKGADVKLVEPILGGLSQPEHHPILVYLLDRGCNANSVDEQGLTPLQLMAGKKVTGVKYLFGNSFSKVSVDCLKALVTHGADTSVLYNGDSLLDIARKCENKDAVQYFETLNIRSKSQAKPISALPEEELLRAALQANSLDSMLAATLELMRRDIGLAPLPDRVAVNPLERVLTKSVCDKLEQIIPHVKQKILGYVFTPELPPRKGVYHLQEDKATFKVDERFQYDPMNEIVIETPKGDYYLIHNIDGYLRGKSTAERIDDDIYI